jgi:hypothetical protein
MACPVNVRRGMSRQARLCEASRVEFCRGAASCGAAGKSGLVNARPACSGLAGESRRVPVSPGEFWHGRQGGCWCGKLRLVLVGQALGAGKARLVLAGYC